MRHFLVERAIVGPSWIRLTCACDWHTYGTPSEVNVSWDQHYGGE